MQMTARQRNTQHQTPRRRQNWGGVLATCALLVGIGWRQTAPQTLRTAYVPAPTRHSSVVARNAAAERNCQSRSGSSAGRTATEAVGFRGIDASYNPTWLEIQDQSVSSLEWMHLQTAWASMATALYAFDMWRILNRIPPTAVEVAAAAIIFWGLYASRLTDVSKLDKHYQVSFYASIGWTFYAVVSLVHSFCYGPTPILPLSLAEPLHSVAAVVFLASCVYFYKYHWGRQIRHVMEGRFRPWFAVGLASLTLAHALSVGHILKMFDDAGWLPTVVKIYHDQWQWIADTRLLELYLTALALFLVILHLRGVLTGTANATIVFVGTVIAPTAALFGETFFIDAVAWQHYFMWGPKHW